MAATPAPPKKFRRDSLKGLAGQAAFKLVATCFGKGSYLETNADVADILIRLTNNKDKLAVLSPDDMTAEFELVLDFGEEIWDCVGVMVSLDYKEGRHAKPYIKIETDWFDGDNEVGYLRKLARPPSKDMPFKIANTFAPDAYLAKATLFYKERRIVTTRSGESWAGKPTFGQLGTSCGPDAMLSILMYADGFYELFNQGLYQPLKPIIDARFNYNAVKAAPYTEAELQAELAKLLPLIPIAHDARVEIKNGERVVFSYDEKTVKDALTFLVYSFIRFYTIESMTVRNYNVSANTSGGRRKTRRRRRHNRKN
jgi:hypothetical protein